MTKNQLLQCALGVHRFKTKTDNCCFRCSICERADHYKGRNGYEAWFEYDEKGNCIHYKSSVGSDVWYELDENGKLIHTRGSPVKSFNFLFTHEL